MPWSVVVFEESESCEAVPKKWLSEEGSQEYCWWPPKNYKVSELINKEAEISHLPGITKFEVRILGNKNGPYYYDSVELARKKAVKAQFESDLSSDTERSRKKAQIYSPPCTPPPTRLKNKEHSSNVSEKLKSLPPPPLSTATDKELVMNLANDRIAKELFASNSIAEELSASNRIADHPKELSRKIPKRCCHDKEWKEKISKDVAFIKLKVDAVHELLLALSESTSLNNEHRENDNHEKKYDTLPQNPIERIEELENLEKKLEDEDIHNFVVKELSKLGGSSVKEVTKRMLRKLLADQVAQDYSFHGFKKKRIFGTLRINRAIFDAVRKTPATVQSSDAEIETVIKDWLRQAKFRLIAKNKTKCPVDHDLRENRDQMQDS